MWMKEISNRKDRICYILMIFLAGFICLGNNAFSNREIWTDSSVFQYVAMEMQQGRVPYLDTFDHKGPLIYVINYLGLAISRSYGIWFLECVGMVVTMLYGYRTARLCAKPGVSLAAVGLSSVFLCFCLQGGNLTEEYAMPLIAIGLYIFLQYFTEGEISKGSIFLCGASMDGVLLLRPNMIAVWIAGCLLVLVDCIHRKTYAQLPGFIGSFLGGVAACVLPFILWLWVRGAMRAAIDSYITFNFQYSSAKFSQMGWLEVGKYLIFHFVPVISAIGILVMLFWDRTNKSVMILLSWMLSIVLILLPGNRYRHYVLVLIPVIVYPIAWLISWCVNSAGTKKKAVVLILAAILCWNVRSQGKQMLRTVLDSVSRAIATESEPDSVVDIILERTDDEDCITVYGNCDRYYLLSHRMSASRYSYQDPIGIVNPEILEEYFDDLAQNIPKVVVWPGCQENPDWEQDRMYQFLEANGYLRDSDEASVFYLP